MRKKSWKLCGDMPWAPKGARRQGQGCRIDGGRRKEGRNTIQLPLHRNRFEQGRKSTSVKGAPGHLLELVTALAITASVGFSTGGAVLAAPVPPPPAPVAGCNYAAHSGLGGQQFNLLTPQAKYAAIVLCNEGVLTGTATNLFSPRLTVTIDQALKFVVKAVGAQLSASQAASFTDVSPNSPYYLYVETANRLGLIPSSMVTNGALNPNQPIQRAEFAALVVAALGQQSAAANVATKSTSFADDASIPAQFRGDVNEALSVGVVPPYNATRFNPNGNLTRAAFALGILRLMYQVALQQPAAVSVSPASASVAVGGSDFLTAAITSSKGTAISPSSLASVGESLSYSVSPSTGATVAVNSDGSGAFIASAPGKYTVTASVQGGNLSAPVTGTTTVDAYGAPAALVVTGPSSLVADGAATGTYTVTAVDASGNPVANFDGNVTLGDSNVVTNVENDGTAGSAPVTEAASNGTAQFTVQSTNGNAGASDTLTATASGLTSGTFAVKAVAQVATSIQVTPANTYLTANESGHQDAVQAEVLDQAGNPMLSGSYALQYSVSGPATFLGGVTGPLNVAFFGNGTTTPTPVTENIESEQGQTGTVTVTVTGQGLTTGTASVDAVIAGPPQQLAVSAQNASVTAGSADSFTVSLEDAAGHPVTAPVPIAVTGTVTSGGSQVSTGTVATISQGASSATFSLTESAAGAYQVTVSGSFGQLENGSTVTTTLTSATTSVTVTAGAVAGLSLSPSGPNGNAIDVPVAAESVNVSAQVQDAAGNPVTEANVPVVFSAGGANSYTVNGASGQQTVETNAQGVASATVAFVAPAGRTITVSATGGANSGITSSVSQAFNVVDLTAAALSVSLKDAATAGPFPGSTFNAQAGDVVAGTITTEASNGLPLGNGDFVQVSVNPADGFAISSANGAQQIFFNGSATPATPETGTNNTYLVQTNASGSISFTATAGLAGTVVVRATDESLVTPVSGQAQITVVPSSTLGGAAVYDGSGNNLAFTPLTVAANTPVEVWVKLTDAEGNPILSSQPQTVDLADQTENSSNLPSGTGAGGEFRLTAEGATIVNQVTVPAGTSEVPVFYVNGTAGTYFILANALGVSSQPPAGDITVNVPSNAPSGTPSTITASFDQNGSPVTSVGLPTSDFSNGVVTFAPPTSGLTPGQTYQVYLVLTYSGNQVIEAGPVAYTAPGATNEPSITATVSGSAPAASSVTSIVASFDQNGQTVGSENVPVADYSNGTITFTAPCSLAQGTYTVVAVVETGTGTFFTTQPVTYTQGSNFAGCAS